MRAFIDTNILLDFLCRRDGYYEDARDLFALGYTHKIDLSILALSVVNAIYIGRKYGSVTLRYSLKKILEFVTVIDLTGSTTKRALDTEWKDYEDSVQYLSALTYHADCIVTRNKKDFSQADIPVFTPTELLLQLNLRD